MNKNILVLGIGNILLCDEGFGPAAINYLQKNFIWPDNVLLVDGATRGLMLMSELLESDLAIVLDIVLAGNEPGSFYKLENEDMTKSFSSLYSMHQTGLTDILISCDLAGHRPETILYGMEPYDYQTLQPFLSVEAEKKLPFFCDMVVGEIMGMGINVKEIVNENKVL